jgi:uncharacterized protein YhfF
VDADPTKTAPDARVERFWQQFVDETGVDGPYTASAFGSDATALGLLVRDGRKRATASNYSWYRDDGEPMPQVGDLSVVLDGEGEPLCVIRTTGVEVRRFGDVDAEFAWTEGEGDRSLAYWREAHIAFFAAEGRPVDDNSDVVLERFELLWPAPQPAGRGGERRSDPQPQEAARRSARSALLPVALVLGLFILLRALINH